MLSTHILRNSEWKQLYQVFFSSLVLLCLPCSLRACKLYQVQCKRHDYKMHRTLCGGFGTREPSYLLQDIYLDIARVQNEDIYIYIFATMLVPYGFVNQPKLPRSGRP